ncbi:helix-turn-helix transcriptional regulator [Kitasatospora sp. NPDC004723]|uniref:helix-turn-helix domain-containing protein n=1 Tax=Kitasatospora sp. NPDC004723 TaxID=3154288 RepID=UPI0033B711E9
MENEESDHVSSPAIRFGNELRRSRRAKGLSQTKLGELMGFSHGLISYIEGAKKPVTLNFAVAADRALGTGRKFWELWRQIESTSLLEGFDEFVKEEARCRRIRTFELNVIPGLFQTEAYASALANAAVLRRGLTKTQATERVRFLMNRQRVLRGEEAPSVHAVMDESCIRRPVGGAAIWRDQLLHLERLAERPGITIQVAPASLGEHIPFTMPVVLLSLRDRSVIGYAESQARGILERDRRTVDAWSSDYDQLQVESLSKAASLAMIRAARKDLQ